MFLTFTGSLSVATGGRHGVRTMLISALGCNLAWGIIDAALYLVACLADKTKTLLTIQGVRETADSHAAQRMLANALPSAIASILEPPELEAIQQRLKRLPAPPAHAHLDKSDWTNAARVLLLLFASTFPVATPFLLMHDGLIALRVSHVIAMVLLSFTGYVFGRRIGHHPWLVGASTLVVGGLLVGLTIALGG